MKGIRPKVRNLLLMRFEPVAVAVEDDLSSLCECGIELLLLSKSTEKRRKWKEKQLERKL
jgi:hypothetical protein